LKRLKELEKIVADTKRDLERVADTERDLEHKKQELKREEQVLKRVLEHKNQELEQLRSSLTISAP